MTKLVRDHLIMLLNKGLREDRRALTAYRQPVSVEYGISSKSAEGSARVRIGDTEVVAGVKLEVGDPFPDTPNQGTLMVGAELLPMSNPEFESGPPSIDSIELARVVDRGLRESKTIDFTKLCITKGEKVWMVMVDIYPINDAGNLFDAASLAALAALKNAQFPEYDAKEGKVSYDKRTSKSLPLTCLPIEVTIIKIQNTYLVDPSSDEWKHLDARLTIAVDEKGTICAMQKGGGDALTLQDIDQMISLAITKAHELRKVL